MSVEVGGARILLTGASGGLGGAIALELDRRGARLLLNGRREDALRELASQLDGSPEILAGPLASVRDAQALAARAGDVDVLVANAGLEVVDRVEQLAPEDVEAAVGVNLVAPATLCALLAPAMLGRGRGQVVLVSSMAGRLVTAASGPLYTATKFGVRGLALGLREDWRGTGVGCSVIFPGPIERAGMFADAGIAAPRGVATRTPEAVAAAVARAIERDVAEIDVAAPSARLAARLWSLAPRSIATLSRGPARSLRARLAAKR